MNFISEKDVLKYYLKLIETDQVTFLSGHEFFKKEITRLIQDLIRHDSMHDQITSAKSLWKILFEASMSHIDPDKGGYDKLFEYFDEYVQFEELIFASDSFYRDHTLHCLWVYFLGEYLAREKAFKSIIHPMYEEKTMLGDMIEICEEIGIEGDLLDDLKTVYHSIPDADSLRCLCALTHDLGYPLKKIKKINSSVKRILPYFGIDHFEEFDFKYQPIQMPFIEKLTQMMSYTFNINPRNQQSITLEMVKKIFVARDDGSIKSINKPYWKSNKDEIKSFMEEHAFEISLITNDSLFVQFSLDLESYQHGIMSAYLLMRNLNVFKSIPLMKSGGNELKMGSRTTSKFLTMQDLFSSISNHTLEGFRITRLQNPDEFLAFVDEIEEFSRISRANQNREFINEFCKTGIEIEDDWFVINFLFDNEEIDNLDPERAFKGRCKKMLTLMDIPNLDHSLKLKLNCIGNLSYDKNIYSLEIAKNHALITINGVQQYIPNYLKSRQFYSTEDYQAMQPIMSRITSS